MNWRVQLARSVLYTFGIGSFWGGYWMGSGGTVDTDHWFTIGLMISVPAIIGTWAIECALWLCRPSKETIADSRCDRGGDSPR